MWRSRNAGENSSIACLAQASRSGASAGAGFAGLLRGQVAGKGFEDSANHQFLALRFSFAGFYVFAQGGREIFALEQIEHSVHGAERLGEVVHDAVQQNFFLLNFLQEFFVFEQGIARGLKPLLLLAESFREVLQQQNSFSIERASGGFERNFVAIRAAFDPIAGIGRAGQTRAPEFFGIHQEILKERRLVGQVDRLVAAGLRAPNIGAPVGPFAEHPEIAIAEIFKQRVSLAGEEGFEDGIRGHLFGQHRLRQMHKGFFDCVARFRAGALQRPARCGQLRLLEPDRFPIDR